MTNNVNILHLDVETSPNLADVWQLFRQNISINQLHETSRIICWAAKWHDKGQVIYYSEHKDGRKKMLNVLWGLICHADVIVTWNGRRFDMPTINREFIKEGFSPPSPYQQIDLLETAKRKFRFPSNKLDFVSRDLLDERKVEHEGHDLWVKCLAGDDKAWRKMEKYNKQDVKLLERLYSKLLPWVQSHPNVSLWNDTERPECPHCGSSKLQKRGFAYTKTMTYQQYHCQGCGAWIRDRTNSMTKEKKKSTKTPVSW